MIRVFVADGHARSRIRHILKKSKDFQVVMAAHDGAELMEQLDREEYDLLLLGLTTVGKSGLDLLKQFKTKHPSLPALVLGSQREDFYAARVLRAGASGYLRKDCTAPQLSSAIHKACNGGVYVSQAVIDRLARDLGAGDQASNQHMLLSDRELEIFHLLVTGRNGTQIAKELGLSIKTVSGHKAKILSKLNAKNKRDLINYAVQHGFIDPPSNAKA